MWSWPKLRTRCRTRVRCVGGRGVAGSPDGVDADVLFEKFDEFETRGGNTRYVVRDDQGRECTTFRPGIGREAAKFEGRRALIEFHEQDRKGFRNVYLDAISPAPESSEPAADTDSEEAAWRTAVDAAPWVLGTSEPDRELPAESSTRSSSRSSAWWRRTSARSGLRAGVSS